MTVYSSNAAASYPLTAEGGSSITVDRSIPFGLRIKVTNQGTAGEQYWGYYAYRVKNGAGNWNDSAAWSGAVWEGNGNPFSGGSWVDGNEELPTTTFPNYVTIPFPANWRPSGAYTIQIFVVNSTASGGGSSTHYVDVYSQDAPTSVSAPTGVSGSFSLINQKVTLNWSAGAQPWWGSSRFDVERYDNVSNTWTAIPAPAWTGAGGTFSITDASTPVDRTLKYRVRTSVTPQNGSAIQRSAWVETAFIYTKPAAPTQVKGHYGDIHTQRCEWVNNSLISGATTSVSRFKWDGVSAWVLQETKTVASGETFVDWQDTEPGIVIDTTGLYYFQVKTVSPQTQSDSVASNAFGPIAPPNAPTGLSPTGVPKDLTQVIPLSWTHSPSGDASPQSQCQIRHRLAGTSTWTEAAASLSSAGVNAPWSTSTYANGTTVEWQVRTWGASGSPSPYSSTATIIGSTKPTVTIDSPTAVHPTSEILVEWTYTDADGHAQAAYSITLTDSNGAPLESIQAAGTATSVTLATVGQDDSTYGLDVAVQDSTGLWSDTVHLDFTVDFVGPAPSILVPTADEASGAIVLPLVQGTADGVTTVESVSATIERRIYDPEAEDYGPWELVIANVAPDATVVDPVGPIHGDGQYRVTTFSATPTSHVSSFIVPAYAEDKWAYLSGGDDFDYICRFWANIEIQWKSSRSKALHYFAGRARPVLYSGEHSERVMQVTGLITPDASNPHKFLKLGQMEGPVAFRAPGNRRIFGSLSEVNVDRIRKGLHKVSFSIQEVYR